MTPPTLPPSAAKPGDILHFHPGSYVVLVAIGNTRHRHGQLLLSDPSNRHITLPIAFLEDLRVRIKRPSPALPHELGSIIIVDRNFWTRTNLDITGSPEDAWRCAATGATTTSDYLRTQDFQVHRTPNIHENLEDRR